MMWSAILHRRDDNSYVVALENGLPYHVPTDHPAWEAVHAAADGMALAPEPQPPPPPTPPPPTRWKIRKSVLIERMTDAELARYDAALSTLTLRQRRRWESITYVWSDDTEVLGFAGAIADEPQEERVAALLAIDPAAQALPD
mgnify:CR=1 FL=1